MNDDDEIKPILYTHDERATLDLLRAVVGSHVEWTDETVRDTPARMLRGLRDLTSGYALKPAEILARTFPAEDYDQIVVVRGIPFASLCEHHVLPFTGLAHVAYLPSSRIVGLSKIPRVVDALARRLQVQERLTREVAGALEDALAPRGVIVVLEGEHACMRLRGARMHGAMVTSDVRGIFRNDTAARAEAMLLMGRV